MQDKPYIPENRINPNPTEFVLDEIYQRQFGTFALPFRYKAEPAPIDEPKVDGNLDNSQPEAAFMKPTKVLAAPDRPWVPASGGPFLAGPSGQKYRMPIRVRFTESVGAPAGEWFQLPNEPIISVRGHVEVTKTAINRSGRKKGMVTEEEYLDDYQITIQGIAYNEVKDAYPEFDMKKIRYHLERAGYLEVQNYLLNQVFGIQFIKIEDLDAPRSERLTMRWAPYSLKAFSVNDFDLT
jgi:Domain of unknown function (DUF6046)